MSGRPSADQNKAVAYSIRAHQPDATFGSKPGPMKTDHASPPNHGPSEAPANHLRLRMRREGMPPPESAPLPDSIHLRTFQPADTEALCRLLETGTFGSWPTQRLDALFDHEIDRLSPRHVHLATHGNDLVGHCCLMVRDEPEGTVGKLGWVVVHPRFRGQGIGRAVCTAALQSAHQLGLETVILDTEDFRISAVRLYLELGFEPVLGDSDATDRFWADRIEFPNPT